MIELKISCETPEEAKIYLNAMQYHNLISDFTEMLRSTEKHSGDIQKVIDTFRQDFYSATHHHEGPY